ncbi:MAG TPA: hypothetical protein VFZ19_07195 [Solirubrobacterales bacterium]
MDRLRLAGIVASGTLLLIAGVLAIAGGDGGSETATPAAGPQLVSVDDLAGLEEDLGRPIYWAGERPSSRLELKQEPDGSVYLRYLPDGVEAGDPRQLYLTVGTYPVADAAAALERTAQENDASLRRLRGGAVLLPNPASQGSAYLAYQGSDLQIEVYDPRPGRAVELIEAEAIRPVGG